MHDSSINFTEKTKNLLSKDFNRLADIREKYKIFNLSISDWDGRLKITFKVVFNDPGGQEALKEIITVTKNLKMLVVFSDNKNINID